MHSIANNNELYHYGVLGMRWGVRRATKKLSKSKTSEQKSKAVNSLQKHGNKIEKKLNKLNKQGTKIQSQMDKYTLKREPKAVKLESKAIRLRNKADYGLFVSARRAGELRAKAATLEEKVREIRRGAQATRVKLEQNKRYREIFSQGFKDVETALVSAGESYVSKLKKAS